jgi:uncharacterized protein YbjT (DUF2867 family)
MSAASAGRPRLLVVGGCGGLVGRAILREFAGDHRLRSVHRHADPAERAAGVEFVAADVTTVGDWGPYLDDVDTVLTVAWYRQAPRPRFAALGAALERLITAAQDASVSRFVQLSVPDAPAELEQHLPYLSVRREVDASIAASGLDYVVVRPTMLFGPGDKLATVMLRTIHRYGRLPLFGDGRYHLSPLSTADLARVIRREAALGGRRTVTVGGPRRWEYRSLAERMFAALGRSPRFVRLSPRNSVRLARLLESVGSTLLYAYEVEWLLSDRLGIPAYEGLGRPLEPIDPFLDAEAGRLRGRSPPLGPVGT